jgi:hypothetical protein
MVAVLTEGNKVHLEEDIMLFSNKRNCEGSIYGRVGLYI